MIREISEFIEYLGERSPDVFSENLSLAEGLYVFLENENDELVIKEENILKVNKGTEKSKLYSAFLERISASEMLSPEKSFNSGPKIFIAIGTPFGIAFSGKGYKPEKEKPDKREKLIKAIEAYFKAASKYIDKSNPEHIKWFSDFQHFAKNKMLAYLDSKEEYKTVKDKYMFYFFHKEPQLDDYKCCYQKYLSERIFNDNSYNIPRTKKDCLPDENTYGIPDSLSGFNSKKPFLEHKTGLTKVNYRVNLQTAFNLKKFFNLQQKNKILPNPMPVFVDENELTQQVIKFYKEDVKKGHKEIIEELLSTRKSDLHNYYLIYFHSGQKGEVGQKGSRIVDIDFVPVFRYRTEDMPEILPLFNIGKTLNSYKINNVFEFQEIIVDRIFNKQLVRKTKNGLWLRYFETIEIEPEHGATETIVYLLYKYRKSFYDYIYKSREQAITDEIFNDIMYSSILDDIRHDKKHDKTFKIAEKLNIWFSLYGYFNKFYNTENMSSKIPELIERCRKIANNDNEHLMDDKEFAFAAGQIIYFLLNQSVASNKTHALLEPFLQKVNVEQLQNAISNLIGVYKHAISFGHGRFERLSKEVLAYETKANIKELQRLILAGYFAESLIYEKNINQN